MSNSRERISFKDNPGRQADNPTQAVERLQVKEKSMRGLQIHLAATCLKQK